VIAASPARIYAALVDPDALVTWLPPDGMTGRMERFDLRAGGSYRMVLTYTDPSAATGKSTPDSDVVDVRFVELVPDTRFVQEVDFLADDPDLTGTMTMTWNVVPVDRGTRVDIVADNVPVGISAEDHAAGFASTLGNLAAYLETSGISDSA
jgi:uncharacterized protein YndB with AHSA1/START domain